MRLTPNDRVSSVVRRAAPGLAPAADHVHGPRVVLCVLSISSFFKANPRRIEDVEVSRLVLHMSDALDGGWQSQTRTRTTSKQTSL